MPSDDIAHPIPDLTGYITEGRLVLSRELHNPGIYPPVHISPSIVAADEGRHRQGRHRSDHPR